MSVLFIFLSALQGFTVSYVSRLLWPWLFGKGFVDDPTQVTGGAASELDGAI